jgi:hypothetical protein
MKTCKVRARSDPLPYNTNKTTQDKIERRYTGGTQVSDFFDSARNFVNSAVSRTSWEAQKQLRLRSKQSEVDKLVEQRAKLADELSQTAMNLYQQGALSDSQLSRLCASIFELDHDLRTREQQMQDIKNEGYPADQFAPSQPMNYAPPVSNPGTPPPPPNQNPANQNFVYPANPGGSNQAGAQGQQLCPQCHNPVRSNSLYCRNCGARVS